MREKSRTLRNECDMAMIGTGWPDRSRTHVTNVTTGSPRPTILTLRPKSGGFRGMRVISVVILTRNEVRDLPACLDSVSWSDDILVFDSFSDDGTVELARQRGVRVVQRAFTGYASQRNASLRQTFAHPWVLILDADERVPRALVEEMLAFVQNAAPGVVAARMRRRDYLHRTWLRYSQLSPFFIRLVRPLEVHYEREVNEVLKPHGAVCDLKQHFDHYPFSKGVTHWLEKHNRYSTMEAVLVRKTLRGETPYSLSKAFFAKDFNERRFHQKELFYRLPGRSLIKFFIMYIARRGFLDGRAGLEYAMLQAIYEQMIDLKVREALLSFETDAGTQPAEIIRVPAKLPGTQVVFKSIADRPLPRHALDEDISSWPLPSQTAANSATRYQQQR